ncbi:hypothetical protein [Defluviimonas salinarum]|uniref:CRISPR-associated protein Cas2 n=1 Tax=Defluviimonas salinarum TaxID=2992147 RepID=A0ABT3J1R3_9RHOB|nr:hypothetical protein [Defluviimonas salinarum]MCW3781359.1 hypothetical protein [Defluviimonas salinarum]
MSTLMVTYDLLNQGQNYDCLIKKIKAYPGWCHLQQSVWLISTSNNCVQVRDNLSSCLDANDKLFVAKLQGEAAWRGHSGEITKWIKENA